MGVHILTSRDGNRAALYCSTTDWAFGPVFYEPESQEYDAEERAEMFCDWCGGKYGDPRKFNDAQLEEKYAEFRRIESDLWKAKQEENAFED